MASPRLLVVLALFIGARLIFAAPAPQEFAGVRWGSTQTEVREMLAKSGAQFDKALGNDRYRFTGGTLAGEAVDEWIMFFDEGRFTKGQVRFEGKGGEDLYRRLRETLNGKYGTGSGAQVAKRKAPHFVLGLGWRSSGSKPPPLHSEWELGAGLDRRSVEIQLWVQKGRVHLAYLSEDESKTPRPEVKAGDATGL